MSSRWKNRKIITGSHPHAVVAGCGITLVGQTLANDGVVIPYDPAIPGFDIRTTQEVRYGRPYLHATNYVYAWRNRMDASYFPGVSGFYYDFISTIQLWVFDVTTKNSPSPITHLDVITDGVNATEHFYIGALAPTGTTLFATSYEYSPNNPPILSVVDISTPSAPTLTGNHTLAIDFDAYLLAYTVSGNDYAIIPSYVSGNSYMKVFDTTGTEVGSTSMNYTIEACIVGTTVYVLTFETDILIDAWDLSNPASPAFLGSWNGGFDSFNDNPISIAAYGTTVFAIVYTNADSSEHVYAVDFSNPASPTLLGSIVNTQIGNPSQIASGANRLHVLQDSVIHDIDSSNPAAMTNCSPDGQAYYNVGGDVWRQKKISFDNTDGYIYGWGIDGVTVPATTITDDANFTVWQIL